MLGLKYVVAKSKELQVKLEQRTVGSNSNDVAASPSSRFNAQSRTTDAATAATNEQPRTRSVSSPTTSGRNEGEQFLALQQAQWAKVHTKHEQLLASGEQLSDALTLARRKLHDQVESEQFIQQHFHTIARVREQIARMRDLVTKIADDAEDVEQFLVQKTEEYMAAQNASFAARQQEELERFEDRILGEKEDRKRQLREARREQLARAFQNDLKTYQTLVTYQGEALPKTVVLETSYTPETLESIDLIVTADAEQLDAFYESASSDEEEEESKRDGPPGAETAPTAPDTAAISSPVDQAPVDEQVVETATSAGTCEHVEDAEVAEVAEESKDSDDIVEDAPNKADQEDDEVAV